MLLLAPLLAGGAVPPSDGVIEIMRVEHEGRDAIRISDRAGLVRADRLLPISDGIFRDGRIEGYLTATPSPGSSANARGFVGIAFRLRSQPTRYDVMYLRMTNGQAGDALRRSRAVQYEHQPDHPWELLRSRFPGRYESHADVAVNRWAHFRIEVRGASARLYLNHDSRPALVVDDLRTGERGSGKVALFIGPETIGYFSEVRATPDRR